jgi:hypothetical protein
MEAEDWVCVSRGAFVAVNSEVPLAERFNVGVGSLEVELIGGCLECEVLGGLVERESGFVLEEGMEDEEECMEVVGLTEERSVGVGR